MKRHEISEKLWEYVHGEADATTKVAIDKAASEDRQLRNELDAIKTVDKNLKKLAPMLQLTEEQLEDRIMAVLEQAPAVKTAKTPARQTSVIFHNFRSILATPWLQYGSLVAAAATILMLFSMYHTAAVPIRWTEPQVVPLQYRGAVDAEYAAAYTKETLAECSSSIEDAIATAYAAERQRQPGSTRKWTLSCRIKELPGKLLCIQVRAYEADHLVREWTRYYNNLEEFQTDLNPMAERAASDLLSSTAGNIR